MRTGAGPWCWWEGLKCLGMLRGEEFALCSLSGWGGGGLCPAGGAGRSVPGISFVKVTDPVVPSVGLGSFLSALHGAYQSNRKHIGSQT